MSTASAAGRIHFTYARALGKNGRVLVRWNGTEPKLRIMLEGPNDKKLQTMARELEAAARDDLAAN